MKRLLGLVLIASMTPVIASADNVGGCGWGSKLFDGQKGIAPQVLAVTTNGTSGNQTFGISSGTSGCTQDGVVKSAWKTAAYIDTNMNKLARHMSAGQGESLDTLGSLLGVTEADKVAFNTAMQSNFSRIFSSADVTSTQVADSIRSVLAENSALSAYSANI